MLSATCQTKLVNGMVFGLPNWPNMGLDYCIRDGEALLCKACCTRKLKHALCILEQKRNKDIEKETGKPITDPCFFRCVTSMPAKQDCDVYQCAIFNSGSESEAKTTPTSADKKMIFDLAWKTTDINDILTKLWMFHFDVNKEVDDNGDYLIHIATKNGECQMPLLELLVKCYNADVNLTDRDGFTCLMIAANMGNAIIVEMLMKCLRADPNIRHPITGRTALHYASQRNYLDIVSILVKYGADYNIEDNDGAQADELALTYHADECHHFIKMCRTQRMNHLVSLIAQDSLNKEDIQSSDLYLTDADGYTLIMAAARMNACKSLDWLVREPHAPINAQHEKTLKTALSFAATLGHVNIIGILMRHGANAKIHDIEGNIPLHDATIHHQVAAVTELLKYPEALTGLYKAQQLSNHPSIQREIRAATQRRQNNIVIPSILESCTSGDADKLYAVLEEGDDVNQQLLDGSWPLYLAVDKGHLEMVKLFYELGADVDKSHPQTGNTILHIACEKGHTEVIAFILNKCAKSANCSKDDYNRMINSFNHKRETPLIVAANKGYKDVVELLLDHGASSAVLDPDTEILYECRHYQGIHHIIEKHRRQHMEIVMRTLAVWKPLKRLQEVFTPRFDHNLRNEVGDTPLMVACRLGKLDVICYLLQSAVYDLDTSASSINQHVVTDGSDCDSDPVLNNCLDAEEPSLESKVSIQKDEVPINGNLENNPAKTEPFLTVPTNPVTTSASVSAPPEATDEQADVTIKDNISKLLDSIASVSRGSVFTSYKHVSHLCATSFYDGCTAYHRAIQNGDNVNILKALLKVDVSAVNIQDSSGLSPVHVACKLKRKKTVSLLTSLPFVDLNCRTLDGTLPEEMTTNKSIISLVVKARNQQPISSSRTLSSVFNGFHHTAKEETSQETHEWNSRFELMQSGLGCDLNMFV